MIKNAVDCAANNTKLLTIGIEPHRPETGYGYIQYSPSSTADKKVKTFTEKPDIELAKKFIETGEFVWNAGIFVWSVTAIIDAFDKYQPELAIYLRLATHLMALMKKLHLLKPPTHNVNPYQLIMPLWKKLIMSLPF